MKGNEVFNNLLKGNDRKVAEIMGITNDELAAVKTITNLKAKLGKESLTCNLKDTSIKIINFWSDFTHSTHHEKELAILVSSSPKVKHNDWVKGLDVFVEKREIRVQKDSKGKAKKIIGEDNHTRRIAKFGRNYNSTLFKLNPCPIKFCKHGVFGELFTKMMRNYNLK